MLSRWPVLIEYPVSAADRDEAGQCRSESLDRWINTTRDEYLGQLTTLAGADLDVAPRPVGDLPSALGAADSVAVSVGVAEVHPDSFTVNARVRALGGTDRAVTVRWTVRHLTADGAAVPIDAAVRDELIALEHAAAHFN